MTEQTEGANEENGVDNRTILDLTVKAGELLLQNGAEIFRVQDTMSIIAKAYGAENFHVYVITNAIFASIGRDGNNHSTEVRNIPAVTVHLGRVVAINNLSREIAEGKHTAAEALALLEEIRFIPYSRAWMQIFACGMGSACFSYLFGGSLWDSAAAFLCGLVLQIFLLGIRDKKLSKLMTNILSSGLVAVCAMLLLKLGLGGNLDKIIIGAIIPLVPGMALTTSIRDIFNSDYLSGTIRIVDALLIGSCIAIGVGAALLLGNSIWGVSL